MQRLREAQTSLDRLNDITQLAEEKEKELSTTKESVNVEKLRKEAATKKREIKELEEKYECDV